MKKTIIPFCILFFATTLLQAQINLNKLKEKAEKTVKNDDKKVVNTKPEEKKDGGSVSPGKATIESSPAAATIRNYRNALSFAKDAVNKQSEDAIHDLEKLKGLLAKIKQEDPNWVEYDKDEAAYLELKDKYEKDRTAHNMYWKLNGMTNQMDNFDHKEHYLPISGFDKGADVKRSAYDEIKKYYEDNPSQNTDPVKSLLIKGDNFYQNVLPRLKAEVLADMKSTWVMTSTYTKEKRAESNYLDGIITKLFDPERHIQAVKNTILICEGGLLMMPNDPELTDQKNKFNERKTDLETYISSGEFAKDLEKRKQMDVDAIRMNKAGMVNAQLDAVIKRDLDATLYGSVLRVSILSTDWDIRKNELGVIIDKSVFAEAATSLNGKCMRTHGFIICDYAGGGNYGKPYFVAQGVVDMNCNNVTK